MNLPNYFLVDLPPEATLSPTMLAEACGTLKHNRERYLATRTIHHLIRVLSQVAESWLRPDYPFRRLALEQGPAATGFSPATIAAGLDGFFRQLTAENLHRLLEQELGHAGRLDEMAATPSEQQTQRAAIVTAPAFLVHVAAGNVPNPTLMSMVLGLLLRSAQFVKCASGGAFLPRLFAHSIYEVEPKLGACLELAEWQGGRQDLEDVLYEAADCVTVTGASETVAAVRHRVPARVRFVPYGHRVSFAYVSGEVLTGLNVVKVVARAAADIVAWNQLGCLSPHVIYVEQGGGATAEQFAELLSRELEQREKLEPRGELPVAAVVAISTRRSIYEMRAANSAETRCWCSWESTAWTVIHEESPQFQLSCLNRFIYVKPVSSLAGALEAADAFRGKVSTVGLAVPEHKAQEMATQLARWGATRVCPLGKMQNPSLLWRHDGRPVLGDLVTWTDWES